MTAAEEKFLRTLNRMGGGDKFVSMDLHQNELGWSGAEYVRTAAEMERHGHITCGIYTVVKLTGIGKLYE